MLRFAPSPTGDMHIGNLRVALFNALLSRQRNEPMIVRIEDTDQERNIEGKDKEILQILDLFGIAYSDVIYQSANLRFHRAMAIQLLQEKRAFNCFCTPEELEHKRETARKNGKPFRYDDTCTHLPAEQTIDNENPFTVRIRRPENPIKVVDIVKGESTFDPYDIDSFIILRAEKYPTYNFACAIDDMLADISVVIRGEDHMSNTPRQIAIRDALGYTKTIEYAHLPIILNDEGKKMSKRDNASSVKWMLGEGFLPEAIANYLILIGNKTPQEVFTMDEAAEWFDLAAVSRAPARFDIDKLRFINRAHLQRLDDRELSRYVGFADESIGKLAKLYLEEASTTRELKQKIEAVFAEKVVPEVYRESADVIKRIIIDAPYFETFAELKQHIIDQSGIKGKPLFKSLRILLTGAEHGPELDDVYAHIKNYLGEIVK